VLRFQVKPIIPERVDGPEVHLHMLFLDLGGARATYQNGAGQAMDMVWPGESAQDGAALRAQVGNGPQPEALVGPGPWGLFRLLDGHLDESGGSPRATWTITSGTTHYRVVYDILPVSSEHPFHADFLRFTLPDRLD
jgi:type VI protein secretion system component VasK